MATIYSNRNDNSSNHITVDPNQASTWLGGVVPLPADQVYVVGRRTTINMGAFTKWTGTRDITVASTANFASSGFFYTITNSGEVVKINYTGTTSTTFTGCSVDETDTFYTWDSGNSIPNGAYVHNSAYILEIGVGQTFECDQLIIQEGGWVFVNGGELIINQGILVRDGRLIGRGSGTITISRPSAALVNMGYLTSENYQFSIIDLEGDEVRTYATLQAQTSVNDSSITIDTPTNGVFAEGDEIAIFETNQYRFRNRGYNGYRDASANFDDLDEGFDIAGVSGNTIYLAQRNGAKGVVRSVTTYGEQKAVEVLPDNIYFGIGDKILIDNVSYIVQEVRDTERTIYNYDFTDTNTDLSDFWVDASDHVYSGGWSIESGVGLKNSGGYSELVHKYFWTRESIIEAEMSPLSAYSSGTRGTAAFGMIAAYDPSFRWGHRGYDTFKSDYLVIDDVNQDLSYSIRSVTNWVNNRPDRVTSVLNKTRGPVTYKVENRKAMTRVTMDGEELTTEYRRDGHFKGLVGIYTNANTNFRCKRFTIKEATQTLYLTTNNSISVGATVYTTGIEHVHPIGSRVLKIASVNTGGGSHKDLAFAYRGQYGNGEWPLLTQVNGNNTVNASLPYTHNHDMNIDYYYNIGDGATAKSITIDLMSQKTFTHVSFVPRVADAGTWIKMNGVTIFGSNDLTNWTTIYNTANDTKFWHRSSYNRMGFYPTGTVSYRYIKFQSIGTDVSPYMHRYVNLGVHNFSEGYTITVNNASDFNIGDTITVMSDSGYNLASREIEGYYATFNNSADPETFWHGGWMMECTITNKVGNKIYLDKPIFWGYVEGEDSVTVVKTNRKFTIRGTIAASGSNNDWRWPNIYMNDGGSLCRKYLFKGIRFQYVGSYRYSGSSTMNRGIITAHDDYWNHMLLDGCSYPMGNDSNTWGNIGMSSSSGLVVRNCYIASASSGIAIYNTSSYAGFGIFNNKIQGCLTPIYAGSTIRAAVINYNELATCDLGILMTSLRVDRGIIPSLREIRYNYIKGSSQYGINVSDETVGPRRVPRIKIENNKIRAMDDYSFAGRNFSGSPYVNTNAMAEHTGSRLSRYRNEGHMAQGDTSSDLSWTTPQHNFGRFGYDLTNTVFYTAVKYHSDPNVTRIFNSSSDAYYWALGIELDVLDNNVPFEINVKFDYRIPLMSTLQDDGTDDGRLRIYGLQTGEVKEMQYGLVPNVSGTEWNTFSGTFSSFAAKEGFAGVFLNRTFLNGYVDIKNSYAHVAADDTSKIRVVGNTFNLERIWDQYGEVRDTKPLVANTIRTINIRKLRF